MKKSSPHRGVLLLVVLALLAMFAMVGVAFVVLTGVEKRNALRVSGIGIVDDKPGKTLQLAYRYRCPRPLYQYHDLHHHLGDQVVQSAGEGIRLRDGRLA